MLSLPIELCGTTAAIHEQIGRLALPRLGFFH